jgi:hypothetical protein
LGKQPAKKGGSKGKPVVMTILIWRIHSLLLLPDESSWRRKVQRLEPGVRVMQKGGLKYIKWIFRNVYATALNKWLSTDDNKILGKQYEYLNFL